MPEKRLLFPEDLPDDLRYSIEHSTVRPTLDDVREAIIDRLRCVSEVLGINSDKFPDQSSEALIETGREVGHLTETLARLEQHLGLRSFQAEASDDAELAAMKDVGRVARSHAARLPDGSKWQRSLSEIGELMADNESRLVKGGAS